MRGERAEVSSARWHAAHAKTRILLFAVTPSLSANLHSEPSLKQNDRRCFALIAGNIDFPILITYSPAVMVRMRC